MKTNALIAFTTEEKNVIIRQFFPEGTSEAEQRFCMNVATSLGLNPILKEIYFVKRSSKVSNVWIDKIEPLVGRDAFLKIAHSSGKFAGMETTTELKPTYKLVNGEWEEKKDLVATCKVYRTDTDRPFIVEVAYNEYVQKTKEGVTTKFWKEKGPTMLKKVAESQALRKAFSISGVYAEDELPIIEVEEVKATPRGIKEQKVGLNAPENTISDIEIGDTVTIGDSKELHIVGKGGGQEIVIEGKDLEDMKASLKEEPKQTIIDIDEE